MTREEAKQVFLSRGYVEVEGGTIYDADKWRESCRVISEWLEQEPCEDAISRQAVLDLLENTNNGWIINEVLQLPSVTPQEPSGETVSLEAFKQVMWERDIAIEQLEELGYGFGQKIEPKTGHWVAIDEEPHEVWECDHCEFAIDGSGCIDPYDYRDTYKFCPNCGIRMIDVPDTNVGNMAERSE